jgi:RNA polymerase sigma-70 factor (ECF subfamily)
VRDGDDDYKDGAKCSVVFDEIYERYRGEIFRVARRITRNRQDAEDVVQECFLNAFVHLESFSGKSQISSWLSRIAINAALMKIRRRRRLEFSLEDFAETTARARLIEFESRRSAPDDQCFQRESTQIVLEALAELSPKLSSVVTLRYFRELSTRECAQILGISLSNAKSRVLRARLSLRSAFDKRFLRRSTPSRLRRYSACPYRRLPRS